MIKRKKKIIEARNIDKSFDGLKVLYKVSLSLNEGETLGIAGASGSGKSTLSKILVGIMEPDSGEVLFRNELLPVVGKREEIHQSILYRWYFKTQRQLLIQVRP